MVERNFKRVKEPRAAQDSRRIQFFGKPSHYFNSPVSLDIKAYFVEVERLTHAPDYATYLLYVHGILGVIQSNHRCHCRWEKAIWRTRIDERKSTG